MKEEEYKKHKRWAREKLFLLISVLGTLFFLVKSPENLNNFTGASTAATVTTFTNSNYFLGIMLFILTLIFAFYILNLVRRVNKRQEWHSEPLGEDDISIATWDTELPLDEKIHQINKELKNLMKETPQMIRKLPRKIMNLPNIKEVRLKGELEKIQNKIYGFSKPIILKAPKKRMELEKNLLKVRNQLKSLDAMKFKKVRFREEVPSKKDITNIIEQREVLRKELDDLHVKMHESSVRQGRKKEEINKDVMDINKKISELENMPIRKVKFKTEAPHEKQFTDMPAKKELQKEFLKLNEELGNKNKSRDKKDNKGNKEDKKKDNSNNKDKNKNKNYDNDGSPKKEKDKALKEIEKKLANLEKTPFKKVMIRTKTADEKHFNDIPDKKRLKQELADLDVISNRKDSDDKTKKQKKKSKALLEIEEKLAKLEEEN